MQIRQVYGSRAFQCWKNSTSIEVKNRRQQRFGGYRKYDYSIVLKCSFWTRWVVSIRSVMKHKHLANQNAFTFRLKACTCLNPSIAKLNAFISWSEQGRSRKAGRQLHKLAANAAGRIRFRRILRAWYGIVQAKYKNIRIDQHLKGGTLQRGESMNGSGSSPAVAGAEMTATDVASRVGGGRHQGRALSYQRRRRGYSTTDALLQAPRAVSHECLGSACWICMCAE